MREIMNHLCVCRRVSAENSVASKATNEDAMRRVQHQRFASLLGRVHTNAMLPAQRHSI